MRVRVSAVELALEEPGQGGVDAVVAITVCGQQPDLRRPVEQVGSLFVSEATYCRYVPCCIRVAHDSQNGSKHLVLKEVEEG